MTTPQIEKAWAEKLAKAVANNVVLSERIKGLEMLVKLYDITLNKLQIPVSMIYQVKDLLDQKKELLGE